MTRATGVSSVLAGTERSSRRSNGVPSGGLARAGGVAMVDGVPDRARWRALAHEALALGRGAPRQVSADVVGDDARNSIPGRAMSNVPGGPVQDELYADPCLRAALSAMCGVPIRPTSSRGTYSFYTRPGDHLGLHVDVDTCDLTMITVLHDSTDPDSAGGALAVYAHHVGWPLSRIRAADPDPSAVYRLPAGRSLVILGGMLPHRVLPLGGGGSRVISALCFRAGW